MSNINPNYATLTNHFVNPTVNITKMLLSTQSQCLKLIYSEISQYPTKEAVRIFLLSFPYTKFLSVL